MSTTFFNVNYVAFRKSFCVSLALCACAFHQALDITKKVLKDGGTFVAKVGVLLSGGTVVKRTNLACYLLPASWPFYQIDDSVETHSCFDTDSEMSLGEECTTDDIQWQDILFVSS